MNVKLLNSLLPWLSVPRARYGQTLVTTMEKPKYITAKHISDILHA